MIKLKEVHYWVAEDGTKFEDGFECEVYEEKQRYEKYFKKNCLCLNWGMKEVNPLDDVGEVRFLSAKTQEVIDWLREQWDTRGYIIDGLEKPGDYVYDEGRYEWELIQERIDFYLKAKNALERT